jgi:hypothetical protein
MAKLLLAYDCGVNLFDAPDMADYLFVGCHTEIEQMERILWRSCDLSHRRVLVLGGMGGIGKTQLSIAYAKRHWGIYPSVF